MAGLKVLTVTSKNSDTSFAGSRLFSANRVVRLFDDSDGNTHIQYKSMVDVDSVVWDDYVVSDSYATASELFAAYEDSVTLTVYQNLYDTDSSTTDKVLDPEDISMGVPKGTAYSVLYVNEGGKYGKILVDHTLSEIETLTTGADPPVVDNPIDDQEFWVGFSTSTVNISNVFSDEVFSLVYTVSDITPAGLVTADISATTLTIDEVDSENTGTADVTVRATQSGGSLYVEDTFTVTVTPLPG